MSANGTFYGLSEIGHCTGDKVRQKRDRMKREFEKMV